MRATLACLSALAVTLYAGGAVALAGTASQESSATITPNTITCTDWTHNANGTWSVGADPQPFDLGASRQQKVTNWTVGPKDFSFDGNDLWMALNQKCGKP